MYLQKEWSPQYFFFKSFEGIILPSISWKNRNLGITGLEQRSLFLPTLQIQGMEYHTIALSWVFIKEGEQVSGKNHGNTEGWLMFQLGWRLPLINSSNIFHLWNQVFCRDSIEIFLSSCVPVLLREYAFVQCLIAFASFSALHKLGSPGLFEPRPIAK